MKKLSVFLVLFFTTFVALYGQKRYCEIFEIESASSDTLSKFKEALNVIAYDNEQTLLGFYIYSKGQNNDSSFLYIFKATSNDSLEMMNEGKKIMVVNPLVKNIGVENGKFMLGCNEKQLSAAITFFIRRKKEYFMVFNFHDFPFCSNCEKFKKNKEIHDYLWNVLKEHHLVE